MNKKYYRSKDKKIAGVAGGFAKYLDVDVTVVRLLFIALTFINGFGAVLYIAAWVLSDPEPQHTTPENKTA